MSFLLNLLRIFVILGISQMLRAQDEIESSDEIIFTHIVSKNQFVTKFQIIF